MLAIVRRMTWNVSFGNPQNAVAQWEPGQCGPQLIPVQGPLVGFLQFRGNFDGARGIFGKKVLLDRLRKDSPHVGSGLQHSVPGPGFGHSIEVGLENQLVDVSSLSGLQLAH